MEALKASDEPPYPHKFNVSISLIEFIEKYKDIEDGTWHDDVVSVSGKFKIFPLFSPFVGTLTRPLLICLGTPTCMPSRPIVTSCEPRIQVQR